MSYIRGRYYSWSDGSNMHIKDLTIPMYVFDELVVMRYNELCQEGLVNDAVIRAMQKYSGNFGCDALVSNRSVYE